MESLDYEAHPHVTVNKATARYMPGGIVALVVAHADPRVAAGPLEDLAEHLRSGVTWIDAAHHVHGTMGLRCVPMYVMACKLLLRDAE